MDERITASQKFLWEIFVYFASVRRIGFYFDYVQMTIGQRGHVAVHNQNKNNFLETETNTEGSKSRWYMDGQSNLRRKRFALKKSIAFKFLDIKLNNCFFMLDTFSFTKEIDWLEIRDLMQLHHFCLHSISIQAETENQELSPTVSYRSSDPFLSQYIDSFTNCWTFSQKSFFICWWINKCSERSMEV